MSDGTRALSINTEGAMELSFDLRTHDDSRGDTFRKGKLEIHSLGVTMDDADISLSVRYEDLEIAEVIGRGNSSYVLKARHTGTNQAVALKVINVFDSAKRNQLIAEINALFTAHCPSVIKFLGAFYREGAITIVTEYMDAGSLQGVLCQAGIIPERSLAGIAFQVLWALSYLKSQERIHRDIKPGNLLVNSQGVVKVTDFGVSASLGSAGGECDDFVGTLPYMSPERMKNEKYSYSADVWSLGLVLVESSTRRFPYRDATTTVIDLVQAVVNGPAPRLDSSRFSTEFCDFVEGSLQKDPRRRLPADALLGAPWMSRNGVKDLASGTTAVRRWIQCLVNPISSSQRERRRGR